MEIRFDVSAKRPEIEFALENVRIIDTGSAPPYEGDYEVTPSAEEQRLLTANRLLNKDIVVRPIPRNYGLITYNGYEITVS